MRNNNIRMYFFGAVIMIQTAFQTQALFHIGTKKIYKGPDTTTNPSLYGYSLAYQAERLYVSDPIKENIGTVYAIDINKSNITESQFPKTYKPKTHQHWLGAVIKSNAEDLIVTCMPRYIELKTLNEAKKQLASMGVCNVKTGYGNNFIEMHTVKVKDRYRWISDSSEFTGIEKMDSFGWSIDITQEKQVFIGGPAIGKGKLIIYNNPLKSPEVIKYDKISRDYPVLYNLGYSIASGYFFERKTSYAASTTFGDSGFGRVYFFDSKYDNVHVIADMTLGSMFGAALCPARLRGSDGTTALLVGAPAFADSDEYDFGAVHIYMSDNKTMVLKQTIKGHSSGGYFGHAIVNLGDMDGDGNDEIAIAAPYESYNEGVGAIYIYTGSGILNGNQAQRLILPEIKNFGFSLTSVQDIDENGCNELAVSSPESHNVVVIKSMAYITVQRLWVEFPENDIISKDFKLKSCCEIIYPDKPVHITADLTITVRIMGNAKFIKDKATDEFEYTYDESVNTRELIYCRSIEATLLKIKAQSIITYTISTQLKQNPLDLNFDTSRTLLSERSVLRHSNIFSINECGNRPCRPSLKLEEKRTFIEQDYIIGSSKKEHLSISLVNTGETAYNPCFGITITKVIFFQPPQGCSLKSPQEIKCSLNKPLLNNDKWPLDYKIQMDPLTSQDDSIQVKYELYGRCSESFRSETTIDKYDIKSDTDGVTIKGETHPDNFSIVTMSDIQLGKTILHEYTISNDGKTNWVGVNSEIILEKAETLQQYETEVTVHTETSLPCHELDSADVDNKKFSCDINVLSVHKKALVTISVIIPPNTIDKKANKKNITIATTMNLLLKNKTKISRLTTTLELRRKQVPIWIIAIASIIGVIIFTIIVYFLYKCGFLQRKTKDELTNLKKEIRRQTIRRSMMAESMRATASRNSSEEVQFLKTEDETEIS